MAAGPPISALLFRLILKEGWVLVFCGLVSFTHRVLNSAEASYNFLTVLLYADNHPILTYLLETSLTTCP